jgi:hypothetical protein
MIMKMIMIIKINMNYEEEPELIHEVRRKVNSD